MIYTLTATVAILAGLVQGVTGFGAGIVLMMVLPIYFALPQSAGIAAAICIILCVFMSVRYREHILWREAIIPSILYIFICTLTINFSVSADQIILKKVFGVFLLLLAAYYLFFKKSADNQKLNLPVSLICIIVSAICDGLFGIGGPLMVLYFLNKTESPQEYLGTLQVFFLINSVYNTAFRFYSGILLPEHFSLICAGFAGIVFGVFIAGKIVDKLNPEVIRKLTYAMIGVSGIANLI